MILFMGSLHSYNHKYSINRIFVFSILLNLFFVILEAAVGIAEGALSLLSDAGHNLGDVFSLLLALIAFRLVDVPPSHRFTYGYKKITVLIALLNALILLLAVGVIVWEAVGKIISPMPVNGDAVSWTAAIGIFVNGLTAWMLMRGSKGDINIRSAFLHMVADTLVSVGVLVSGIAISLTGYYIIDPLVSMSVAVVILFSMWRVLSESLRLSIDGIPSGIDYDRVKQLLEDDDCVVSVHHIHIWAISTNETALTAHVAVLRLDDFELVKGRIKMRLAYVGIAHCTLEPEIYSATCSDVDCR